MSGAPNHIRKIYSLIVLIAFAVGLSLPTTAAEKSSCAETVEFHQINWTGLPIHKIMQSRNCHSQLSDALKMDASTNEMLSHAVYHQILAGESFRKIPLWPDKHDDWDGTYGGYSYTSVFLPALKAARESWDDGFEGGVKHDFAIGWTQTITESDFEINHDYIQTGRKSVARGHLLIPGLVLVLMILIEALFNRYGWFPNLRLFYRNNIVADD